MYREPKFLDVPRIFSHNLEYVAVGIAQAAS